MYVHRPPNALRLRCMVCLRGPFTEAELVTHLGSALAEGLSKIDGLDVGADEVDVGHGGAAQAFGRAAVDHCVRDDVRVERARPP